MLQSKPDQTSRAALLSGVSAGIDGTMGSRDRSLGWPITAAEGSPAFLVIDPMMMDGWMVPEDEEAEDGMSMSMSMGHEVEEEVLLCFLCLWLGGRPSKSDVVVHTATNW